MAYQLRPSRLHLTSILTIFNFLVIIFFAQLCVPSPPVTQSQLVNQSGVTTQPKGMDQCITVGLRNLPRGCPSIFRKPSVFDSGLVSSKSLKSLVNKVEGSCRECHLVRDALLSISDSNIGLSKDWQKMATFFHWLSKEDPSFRENSCWISMIHMSFDQYSF